MFQNGTKAPHCYFHADMRGGTGWPLFRLLHGWLGLIFILKRSQVVLLFFLLLLL